MNELKMYLLLQNHRWFSSHVFWRVKPAPGSWTAGLLLKSDRLSQEPPFFRRRDVKLHGCVSWFHRESAAEILCEIVLDFLGVFTSKVPQISDPKTSSNHSDGKERPQYSMTQEHDMTPKGWLLRLLRTSIHNGSIKVLTSSQSPQVPPNFRGRNLSGKDAIWFYPNW